MALRVSILRQLVDLEGISSEWRGLAARCESPLPFAGPDWMIPWWTRYHRSTGSIHDELSVRAIRDEAGTLVGLTPLMRTTRPGVGPFRVRILRFLGADPYITEQPVSLADPARAAEIGLACAQSVSHERDWDWVQWRGLLRGDPFSEAVVEHLGVEIRGEEPANLLHVGTRWETFRASRKRNIKESLRRGYNSLKREGIAFRLHVHEAPSDVRPALASFFDLHARRAELAGTVPHPNRFPSERSRQFLEEVCMRFAEQRALRIFQLEIAGEPVAMRVAFATPRALYLYYSGYDPRFRRYGVMTTLVAEAIQYAISKRIPRVHLSMGADVSKSRWGPEMPLYCDGVAVRPSVIAHAKWRSVQLARKARALGFFGVE